ncbi:MAG: UTRA domain-containing protein, partial [Acidimicrobiales bacterium]
PRAGPPAPARPGPPGPTVLRVRRLNLADGEPFARVTVWARGDVAAGLSPEGVERSTFYELLGGRLASATQTIAAAAAGETDAGLLGVPAGSPVLLCERVTFDRDRVPVLVAEHVFPGLRTEFVVELTNTEPSMAPSGLRLVE